LVRFARAPPREFRTAHLRIAVTAAQTSFKIMELSNKRVFVHVGVLASSRRRRLPVP
jgi:hypothetical protein